MSKRSLLGFGLLLLAEYVFIFSFLLNYDLAWLNPEKLGVEPWILSNGASWHKEDWLKFLNIEVIESNPDRLSRPLSNFVEVVNTKWRAWWWNFVTPHPALSLMWPLMLFVVPYLLFRTFINMGCVPSLALAGSVVYLSTLGFLAPLVMLFHPAKNLVNFFAVLSLFFFSLASKQRWFCAAGFASLFLGFFSDETGLFMYPVVLAVFFPLWRQLAREKRYGVLAGLAALPLMYAVVLKCVLPFCHWKVLGKWVQFNNYESYPSLSSLFFPDAGYLWQNTKLLFADHPHWAMNYQRLLSHPVLFLVQLAYLAVWAGVVWNFGKAFRQRPWTSQPFLRLTISAIALMFGYCWFQTFQLSRNAHAWGIWWYGSLFSLLYVIALVFFLQYVLENRPGLRAWLLGLAVVFAVNGLVFSTFRMAVFKMQNLDRRDFAYQDIFSGKIDEYQYFSFKNSLLKSSCKKTYARVFWHKWKSMPAPQIPAGQMAACQELMAHDFCLPLANGVCLPVETLYLNAELQ